MRILQLCHRVPYPPNDGGNIAMLSLTNALASQDVEIKLLALNTKKHYVDLSTIPEHIKTKYSIEAVYIDTSVRASKAIINLFTSDSYNVSRFYSIAFLNKLNSVLKETEYDVVLLESLFMTPYIDSIRQNSKAKIVLRAHNVEQIIWERLATNEKNILKKKYFKHLAKRLKKGEVEAINKTDAVLPITMDDESIFKEGAKTPMLVVPVGVDWNEFNPNQQTPNSQPLSLFHLGAMDWMPNLEGVQWFLKDCWPLISKEFPSLMLYLAGRGFPEHIINDAPKNVVCQGEIKHAEEYMSDKQIMIVPLFSGSGMRVKIIQGMALGKTIISTTIGAEGINYTDADNILIANSPKEFLEKVSRCINVPEFCFSLGKAARQLIQEQYSNEAIGKKVKQFLANL